MIELDRIYLDAANLNTGDLFKLLVSLAAELQHRHNQQ